MGTIYLSQGTDSRLLDYLRKSGRNIHAVLPSGKTYSAIDSHADIYYCKMGVTRHNHIFSGAIDEIGGSYPQNVRFNAVCLDSYFIHNLRHTSPSLLREALRLGLELIDVNQGYTKCNCVVVDGSSVITADQGIVSELKKHPDINVLQIRQGSVRLEGFEYGFLGGASGRVGNEIVFNGNITAHPDYAAIAQFISSHGLGIKFFLEYPLTDIGSILTDF